MEVVILSGKERHQGMRGSICSNYHRGALVELENGEKISLQNDEFEYIAENISQPENRV